MMKQKMVTSPLKWAGGKRWQVPSVLPLWNRYLQQSSPDVRFVEPFCGSMSMSFGIQPHYAVLNDVNPHLMNFFGWLQSGLEQHNVPFVNDENIYYQNRERFNDLIDKKDIHTQTAAALFYYLNRTGFNGLCRFNKSGRFNVPFGKYKTINYVDDFVKLANELGPHFRYHWRTVNIDFLYLRLYPDDFIYADPPYDVEFTTYSAGGFSWTAQQAVAQWLAIHPGPVVLVNQATPRIIELYRDLGYSINYLDAPRRISCTGDRTPAREIFATRNLS